MKITKNNIPPYVAFKTFQTFLEFLSQGMPSRIDRSVWVNRFSGSNGTQLMTAIKFFELVDSDGVPSQDFNSLVSKDLSIQKKTLRKILFKFYDHIFELDLDNATRYQFREAFKKFGTKEGVLVKCESFFIQAAKFSDISLSNHILARRHNNKSNSNEKIKSQTTQVSQSILSKKNSVEKNTNIVKIILDKYPEFDPSWTPEVQKAWIESLTKLYESLSN
ncbi:MAG: hypothetical protein CL772_00465 [Chloroflexi bacterium]|nr:hypothetical protein [Chloroflexota bacterium]|tara:strand:+ start:7265 stop:7924 length:660 start_codon:yes stop_codon:yes gene_type:complete